MHQEPPTVNILEAVAVTGSRRDNYSHHVKNCAESQASQRTVCLSCVISETLKMKWQKPSF